MSEPSPLSLPSHSSPFFFNFFHSFFSKKRLLLLSLSLSFASLNLPRSSIYLSIRLALQTLYHISSVPVLRTISSDIVPSSSSPGGWGYNLPSPYLIQNPKKAHTCNTIQVLKKKKVKSSPVRASPPYYQHNYLHTYSIHKIKSLLHSPPLKHPKNKNKKKGKEGGNEPTTKTRNYEITHI